MIANEVEQCSDCAETVAVYSDRQKVDGDVYCSSCRRRNSAARRRASKPAPQIAKPSGVLASKPDPKCSCQVPRPIDGEPDRCAFCWLEFSKDKAARVAKFEIGWSLLTASDRDPAAAAKAMTGLWPDDPNAAMRAAEIFAEMAMSMLHARGEPR